MGSLLGIFSQIANKTVANTAVETSLLNLTQGSNNIPPSFWEVGKSIKFNITGFRSRTSGNENYRIKLGSTVIINSGAILFGAGSNGGWDMECILTVRSLGVAGTIQAQGRMFNWTNGNLTPLVALAPTVINTTIPQLFDFTVQWGTANAGNTITSTNCSISY